MTHSSGQDGVAPRGYRPNRRQALQAGGLAAAALFVAPGLAAAQSSPGFRFGACGHPFASIEYGANGPKGVSYATQVDMLTTLGMNVYRGDVRSNAEGRSTNHDRLLDMYGRLRAANISPYPMIGPSGSYSTSISEAENYERGYVKGVGLATNYGDMFTHCNIGNEWELFQDLKFKGKIGHKREHWDMPRTVRAMRWIKGVHEGMKSVKPELKTSVATAGWFPTWWQEYLLNNIDLDFVDWHWYSDHQGNIDALPGDITNILDFLWSEYGLPIWVSESNTRPKEDYSQEWNEQRQTNWYKEWYAQCAEHPHCDGLLLYELLDQPRVDKGYDERNYGLVKFPGDVGDQGYWEWEWKQFARQWIGRERVIGHFGSDAEGWRLGLGREFPGAKGTFVRDDSSSRGGDWSGVLTGDFGDGGNYVQIARSINDDTSNLRFWVRSADASSVGLRMTDSTGQIHQQTLPITADDEWQALHVDKFDGGRSYLSWGGANDGVWHGPATGIALLLPRTALGSGATSGSVRFDVVAVTVGDRTSRRTTVPFQGRRSLRKLLS